MWWYRWNTADEASGGLIPRYPRLARESVPEKPRAGAHLRAITVCWLAAYVMITFMSLRLLGVVQGSSQALGNRRTEYLTSTSYPSICTWSLSKHMLIRVNFGSPLPVHVSSFSCLSTFASVSLALQDCHFVVWNQQHLVWCRPHSCGQF